MKIKYVGVKQDGETAFASDTKIARWMRGDVHDIEDASLVKRMLNHPDVFASVTGAQPPMATPAPTPAPSAPAAAPAAKIAPGAAIPAADPLADLDDAAVRAFAKSNGLKIQGVALFKGAKLRAKVSEALAAIPAPK